MGRIAIGVLTMLLASGVAAWAQSNAPQPAPFPNMFQGTAEEQAACRPDSARYCKDAIPDTFRVLACLQANREKIGKPCRMVLESHGQ